ncbi:MAG: nucleotidyl transferase AbiEii/AbiGii toxin family protein [Cyanobacteria bacterium]|nr:nucleotidyl transferase AbiEii/AbiGii toxin family protein [Cyanobacteriota bacterium]
MLRTLRDTADALRERNQPFALVGGLAVSIRCEPRFTRDIDLAVAVDDDAVAEGLIADLIARAFTLQLSLEHAALGRLAAVRLVPPGGTAGGVVVDLLFASSGIEADVCAAAEVMEIAAGLSVPVAAAGHLLVMKLLARSAQRPQDDIDAQALVRVLDATERARAKTAAARIEKIGANRGKPLRQDLEALLG